MSSLRQELPSKRQSETASKWKFALTTAVCTILKAGRIHLTWSKTIDRTFSS
jgi:hypothetical protein